MPQNWPLLRSFAVLCFVFVDCTTAYRIFDQVPPQNTWATGWQGWISEDILPSSAGWLDEGSAVQTSILNGIEWPNGGFMNFETPTVQVEMPNGLLSSFQTCECPCDDDQQEPLTLSLSLSHFIFKRSIIRRCRGVVDRNGNCRPRSRSKERQRQWRWQDFRW